MEKIDINIRLAEKKDAEKVASIRQTVWKSTYTGLIDNKYFDNFNLKKETERNEKIFSTQKIAYIIENNNEVIGFFFINKVPRELNGNFSEAELGALYILDNYQRIGIGKKVFEFIKLKFKKENIKSFRVWCLETNLKGKNFYENQGGKIIGSKPFGESGKEIAYLFNV